MAAILLNSVYTTGAGGGHYLGVRGKTIHSMQVILTDANASITALTVKLQGTMQSMSTVDASAKWYDIGELVFAGDDLTNLHAAKTFTGVLAKRVRANITTITGAAAADNVKVIYEQGEI